MEDTITITVKEYETLKNDALWVQCLEEAGVDNWAGIDFAYEIRSERVEKEVA